MNVSWSHDPTVMRVNLRGRAIICVSARCQCSQQRVILKCHKCQSNVTARVTFQVVDFLARKCPIIIKCQNVISSRGEITFWRTFKRSYDAHVKPHHRQNKCSNTQKCSDIWTFKRIYLWRQWLTPDISMTFTMFRDDICDI